METIQEKATDYVNRRLTNPLLRMFSKLLKEAYIVGATEQHAIDIQWMEEANGIIRQSSDELVDLGLSVKWMRCNLGAKKETELGRYYQWGKRKGHDRKDFFQYYRDDYVNTLAGKYDGNVLNKVHDAVTVIYGKGYRMPTEAECNELLTLKNKWVENYKGSGRSGRVFYGIGTGKGNTLFIPAAGFFHGNILYGEGCNGSIWSSELYGDKKYAHTLTFTDTNIVVNISARSEGCSIRGVSENKY